MKKYLSLAINAFIFLFLSHLLSSCIKDTCERSYSYIYYQPVYKTTAEVRANIRSNPPEQIIQPGKIVVLGNYIFLNEVDKGIHIIDNSNPSSPQNIAFIDIPGNEDLAVKGNTMYADLYTDLVTLDISNPLNVTVKKYNEGVFPYRVYTGGFYGDTTKIIVDWLKRDTTIFTDCNVSPIPVGAPGILMYASSAQSAGNSAPTAIGQEGSMARFAILNNDMYTVSNSDLNVFDITDPFNPVFSNTVGMGNWNIETIFPYQNNLFIGSQNGIYIYNTNNPNSPSLDGQFGHVQTCDPVIADNNYAYVTLRSGNACQGFTNELDILQLNSLTDPQLVKVYDLTNPFGLSKDANLLFICDGSDGLKIFDASDVQNLQLVKEFSGIQTYDVIAANKKALVVAADGLYQYDYSDVNNIHLVSKIGVSQ